MHTHAKRSHTHVTDPMVHQSEFGGLSCRKRLNKPACTQKYQSLQGVEVGHYKEEEEVIGARVLALESQS